MSRRVVPSEEEPVPELPDQVRRRLDEVFGDVLPSTTTDERDETRSAGTPDEDLLADRPPHHDRD